MGDDYTYEQWDDAKERLEQKDRQYKELSRMPGVNVTFVRQMVIAPLRARYDAGERTVDLYEAMQALE